MNVQQQIGDVTTWSRSGLDGVTVQASIIEHAITTAMPEPEHDLLDEDEDPDDTYINGGVVPPFSVLRDDSDDDLF
jgi:hypothetical protein